MKTADLDSTFMRSAYGEGGGNTEECPECGRRFVMERLDKHVAICSRVCTGLLRRQALMVMKLCVHTRVRACVCVCVMLFSRSAEVQQCCLCLCEPYVCIKPRVTTGREGVPALHCKNICHVPSTESHPVAQLFAHTDN